MDVSAVAVAVAVAVVVDGLKEKLESVLSDAESMLEVIVFLAHVAIGSLAGLLLRPPTGVPVVIVAGV